MRYLVILLAVLILSIPVLASDSATQTVTMQVLAINEVAVHGDTYAISTNCDNKKIMVAPSKPLPDGTTLEVRLEAPTGAKSLGKVVCQTGPADAVVAVSRIAQQDLKITCRLINAKKSEGWSTEDLVLTIADM